MRGRWLLNLALLVAVLLLGALALRDGGDEQQAVTRLTGIDPLTIRQMRIEREGQPAIELEKTGDQWRMREPYQALANNQYINRLLSVIETPTYAQFGADRDLAQYGLDKPDVHLVMNNDLRISLGGIEPLGKRRFVRLGDTIHVIGDSPFAQLTAAASLLVDTALFESGTVIKGLELPGARFQKQADGSWQVSPPGDYTPDTLNIYIDEWQHARAVFLSDPEKPGAGDELVTVTLADDSIARFGIIRLDTGMTLVNRQSGLHYHLAEDIGEQLLNPPKPAN